MKAPPNPMQARMTPVGVALAVAVALLLRLHDLDQTGLWLDELFSVRVIQREGWAGLLDELRQDVHPPLYFALLKLWSGVVGSSDAWLRAPSALAGALTVAGAGVLAARVWGPREAVVAAWLTATAPYLVIIDREARGNALLTCLAVWSTALLVDAPRERGPGARVLYLLLAAAMVNVHLFGVFVVAAHVAWLFLARVDRAALGRWLPALAVALAALLPWTRVLAEQVSTFTRDTWYSLPPPDAMGWLLHSLTRELTTLSFTFALLLLAGLWRAVRHDRPAPTALFLAFLLALVALPALISLTVSPILRPRSVLPLVPILCVVASGAVAWLPSPAAIGLTALLAGLQAFAGLRMGASTWSEEWREAARSLRSQRASTDLVYANHPHLWSHYLGEVPRELGTELPDGTARVWVLHGHSPVPDGLFNGATEVGRELFQGATLVRLQAAPRALSLDRIAPDKPELHDADGLHLWWAGEVWSEGLELWGRCWFALEARGDPGGGELPRLDVRLVGAEGALIRETVELGPDWAVHRVGPVEPVKGALAGLGLALQNDGPEGGPGDRNAHIRAITVACEDGP